VAGFADKPSGRQMISTYVGGALVANRKWAYYAAAIIDYFAYLITGKRDHCLLSYERFGQYDH